MTTTMTTTMTTANKKKSIVVRSVWSANLDSEFLLIRSVIQKFRFVSMDTEFPGLVYRADRSLGYVDASSAASNYSVLKMNVDATSLIQVGLTLSDADGNLPEHDSGDSCIWEFNFRDFDLSRDQYAPDSIELLMRQGIDFERNRIQGIDSFRFAELLMSSGLVCDDEVTWVTFHSAYDFGFLIKLLTGRFLPAELFDFLNLLRAYFGSSVYDVKHIIRYCDGLYGGLDRVATSLQVCRAVGNSHQAGSDSLLTWQTFHRMKEVCFPSGLDKYAGVLFGL